MRLIPVILAVLLLSSCAAPTGRVDRICFPEKCITAEIADTPPERERGLMGRTGLSDDEGMIFVFDNEGEYSFWMKNMEIPIDMFWVGKDMRITHIEKAVPPCAGESCPVYTARGRYVIETAADFSERYNVSEGDAVLFGRP